MEKRTPHCKLTIVKQLIKENKIRTTQTARLGAVSLGIDFIGMVAIIEQLTNDDFYKSMTTHANHTIWQDVYRPNTEYGDLYIKLTVIDDVLIVSFKEL